MQVASGPLLISMSYGRSRCRLHREQRKEASGHRLTRRNRRHPGEQFSVGTGQNAVAEYVDHGRTAGAVAAIFVRAVDHQGMVERALAFLQLDGDGLKRGALLV